MMYDIARKKYHDQSVGGQTSPNFQSRADNAPRDCWRVYRTKDNDIAYYGEVYIGDVDKHRFYHLQTCNPNSFLSNDSPKEVNMSQLQFLPTEQTPELKAEISLWNNHLALLRGDNIYDVSRLYFSHKGWNCNQLEVTATIPYGSTVRANDKLVLQKVEELILKPAGLFFMRTLMGRQICDDKHILGAFVNPTNSSTQSKYDILGTEALVTYVHDKFNELIENGVVPYLSRLTLSDKAIVSTVETIPPAKEIPDVNLFYPYMKRGPAELMRAFMKSTSNVLLLIGEPGTGKSNFVLQMLNERGWDDNIHLADREDVLLHPGLSDYIRNCTTGAVFIAEDADKLVMKRTDGNETMQALLNASAGIVSRNVKVIINTNLESLQYVDAALVRPGRCFDVISFQKLTADQGMTLRYSMGLPEIQIVEKEVTLAEALKYDEIHADRVVKSAAFGFNQG